MTGATLRGLAASIVVAALAADWKLIDYLLASPESALGLNVAFVYLFVAFVLTWGALIGARAIWTTKRIKSSLMYRSGEREFAIQSGLLILSFVCIIAVPEIRANVRNQPYDPIGVGSDVGTPPCETQEIFERGNGKGDVASVRRSVCSGDWDPVMMYFVFVHRAGQANTRKNLVFRYEGYSAQDTPPPTVSWVAENSLRIDARGYIFSITKQRARVYEVSIAYRAHIDHPSFGAQ